MFFSPYSLSLSGLYLSFAGSILSSTADLGKRYLLQRTNSAEIVLLLRGAAHVVFFAIWATWEGIPVKAVDMSFLGACLLLGGFNAVASWLYLGALKQSLDLSLPYLGVGPFFVTFLSYLVFEDIPKKPYNLLGLLLILLGYLGLNLSQNQLNFSFSSLFFPSSKPSRQMLIVAVIWNVSQMLEKNCLNYVTPIQFGLYVQGVSFLLSFFVLGPPLLSFLRQGNLPIAHGKEKERIFSIQNRRSVDWELVTSFISISAVSLLAYYIFLLAVRSTYVTFVMLTKRLGIILTIFLGRFFFPEDYNRFRFLCCVVIQVGCALVYLPHYGFWFAGNWETGSSDESKLAAVAT